MCVKSYFRLACAVRTDLSGTTLFAFTEFFAKKGLFLAKIKSRRNVSSLLSQSKAHIVVLQVNDPGRLAAVTVVVFGPVVLMDLVTHSRMYEISNSTFRRCESIFTSQN